MATAPPLDINVYRLRLLRIIETLGENVLRFILKHGTNTPNPSISLQDYLDALDPQTSNAYYCKLTNKKKRELFTKTDKNQISADLTWDTFDVTLLWKAIRCACEDIAHPDDTVSWGDMNSLEGLIKKIKDERNEIIHEKHQLMPNEYEAKVKALKGLFTKTLEEAQTRYSVLDQEITDEKQKIEDGIQHISGCFKIEEMCQDRTKLLQTFKEFFVRSVNTIYQRTQIFDPLCFLSGSPQTPLHIQDIFSNIYIMENQTKVKIPHSKIIGSIQSLGQPPLHILKGGPGAGKSTLYLYLLSDWLKDDSDRCIEHLNDYDILLYVVCRDRNCASLEEFLKRIFPEYDVFGSKTIQLLKDCKVLVLIDGLDELNSSSSQLVEEILDVGRMVPAFHILCTSRPEVVVDFLKKAPREFRKGEAMMEGISPQERFEFVAKYYRSLSGNSIPVRDKHVIETILWRDHFGLPLNLLFLTTLMCDHPDSVRKNTTQTKLYVTIHEWCIEKLLYRLTVHPQTRDTDSDSCKEGIMRVVDRIGMVALQGILLNQLNISPGDKRMLEQCCRDEKLPSSEVLGAFVSLRESNVNRVIHKTYCTPHKGLQEFYSAMHIVNHLDQKSVTLGEVPSTSTGGNIWRLLQNSSRKKLEREDINNLRNLLLHVAGLLSQPGVSAPASAIKVRLLTVHPLFPLTYPPL